MNVQSSCAFLDCESVASHFEGSAADRELCPTKCYLLSRRSELQIHILLCSRVESHPATTPPLFSREPLSGGLPQGRLISSKLWSILDPVVASAAVFSLSSFAEQPGLSPLL